MGIILGMFVLASFMTGLLGMALSEKNREYFVYRLKNIRHLPLFKPTDPRFKYGLPPESNANYLWIQHFIYHLSPNGKAGLEAVLKIML